MMKFKVITRNPEDVFRSNNGGDYREGFWLEPSHTDDNGNIIFRKTYFSSFEGGFCKVTGTYQNGWCEYCNSDLHEDYDYEYMSGHEVYQLLVRHNYEVVPKIGLGLVYSDFYVEIDCTKGV